MPETKALRLDELIEFAKDGTVSKTVLDTKAAKVTLFCMAAGQELTEHTAGQPVSVHFIEGEGEFIQGGTVHPIKPGAWFYLEARAAHALRIHRNTVFLLTLFRS